ncbi:MAG: beta-ketoacyl synthase, partial [Actinomycetota bacterium]|nr:beta-ketoacyl synthase [Actinomycetota bacterium]
VAAVAGDEAARARLADRLSALGAALGAGANGHAEDEDEDIATASHDELFELLDDELETP